MKLSLEESVAYINEHCTEIEVVPSNHKHYPYKVIDKIRTTSYNYWEPEQFIEWAERLRYKRQANGNVELEFNTAVCYCTVKDDLREVIKFPSLWKGKQVKVTVTLEDEEEDEE